MTQINPFTGAVIQSGQVSANQNASRQRQIRRLQNLSKNTALRGDDLEHQVESSDALHGAHNEESYQPRREQPQRPSNPSGQEEHIDLTA